MGVESYNVKAILSATDKSFSSTFEKAKNLMGSTASAASKASSILNNALGHALGNAVSKAFNAVNSSVDGAISRVDALKSYPKVMTTLGYETKASQKSIAALSDSIDGLPTTLDEIVNNAKMLTASLGDLGKGTATASALNDMFLAGGQGAEAAGRALTQYNQILAKGKVDQQSWNTMVEVAPAQLNQLAQELLGAGKNQKDLYEALQKGSLSIEDFNNKIIELDKKGGKGFKSFHDQALQSTGGIATSLKNIKSAVTKGVANVITGVELMLEKNGLPSIAESLLTVKQAVNSIFGKYNSQTGDVEGGLSGFIKTNERLGKVLKGTRTFVGEFFNALDGYKGSFPGLATAGSNVSNAIYKIEKAFGKLNARGMAANVAKIFNNVTKASSPFIAAFGNMVGPVMDVAGSIGNFVTKLLGSEEASTFIGNVVRHLSDTFGDLATGISGAIDGLSNLIGPVFTWLNQIVESVGPHWDAMSDSVGQAISALGQSFGQLSADQGTIDGVAGVISTFCDAVKSLADFVTQHSDTIAQLAPVVAKAALAFILFKGALSFGKKLSGITSGLGKIKSYFESFTREKPFGGEEYPFKPLDDKLPSTGATAKDTAIKILSLGAAVLLIGAGVALAGVGLKQMAQGAVELANSGGLAIGVFAGMLIAFGALIALCSYLGAGLTAGAVGMLAFGAMCVLVAAAVWIISAAIQPLAPLIESLVTIVSNAVVQTVALMPSIIDSVSGMVDSVSGVINSLGEVFGTVFDGISEVVNSVFNGISGVIDSIAGVFDSIGNAALNAGTGFEKLANGLTKLVGLNLLDLAATMTAVAAGLGEISANAGGISKVGDGMAKTQSAMVSLPASCAVVGAGFKAMSTSVVSSMNVLGSSTSNSINKLQSNVSKAQYYGQMIGVGLANGIRSQIGAVQAAAEAIAQAADKAIRAKAKIGSPSKVTTEDGMWTGQGYVNGILSKVRDAKKASEKLFFAPGKNIGKLNTQRYNGSLSNEYSYSSQAKYTIEVPLNINGRKVAKATASYNQEELDRKEKFDNRLVGAF